METENKEQKRRKSTATLRKASQHGQITQKMMAFKIDLDLWELLAGEANKGRLINNLLRAHYGQQESQ